MSEASSPICVKRILVSMDCSKHSFAALKSAVKLANHYDARLKGIFIEDINLLNLAKLPFHQEVGEYSASIREISTDYLSRGIFVQSRWIIRTWQRIINNSDLENDISIMRGNVLNIIDQESNDCDLLIIGKSGTNPVRAHRLGSTAKTIIRKMNKSILLVEEGNRLNNPIIVLYDDSPIGKTCLETGSDFLDEGETLVVLLDKEQPDVYQANKTAISLWASKKNINISFQSYQTRYFNRFHQLIDGIKTGLMIMPSMHFLPEQHVIKKYIEKISLPILFVTPPLKNIG